MEACHTPPSFSLSQSQANHAVHPLPLPPCGSEVLRRIKREVKTMENPPKSQTYYQVVDLIEAEKRRWEGTLPERKWAVVGRSIFHFFDQNGDGVIDRCEGRNATPFLSSMLCLGYWGTRWWVAFGGAPTTPRTSSDTASQHEHPPTSCVHVGAQPCIPSLAHTVLCAYCAVL